MKWSIWFSIVFWSLFFLTMSHFKGGDLVNKTPVQYKRLFIDIPVSTDEKLVAEAKAQGVSKKAFVENLILGACDKSIKKRSK